MSAASDNREWQRELEDEVKRGILDYWMNHTVDKRRGGFLGEIASDGTVVPDAPKGLVLNARILWSFASAYRIFRDEAYLTMARRAYEALDTKFRDREHGGLFWLVDVEGRPLQDKKQVYGQAFVIYALAEYDRAVGSPEAVAWAAELYRLLEKHAYDPVHLGYIEALARDWSETDDLSLSGKDLNERKSMNTHLHVLEAYTNLYRVWKPEGLRAKLKELIEVHLDKIIDPSSHHFLLFFDDEWHSQSAHVSYGHDIEGSWLLCEAAEVLGDEALLKRVRAEAIRMADVTLEQGVDEDGAIFNEFDGQDHLDDAKDWWPQAEAMVGFLNAWQLTGEEKYADAARRSWAFILRFIVNRETGEWHWGVSRQGEPDRSQPKVSPWKCPYHNSRACLEALERLAHISKE